MVMGFVDVDVWLWMWLWMLTRCRHDGGRSRIMNFPYEIEFCGYLGREHTETIHTSPETHERNFISWLLPVAVDNIQHRRGKASQLGICNIAEAGFTLDITL